MNELNETVFCRLAPSSIQGIGVFAIRDIPKGQKITNFDGRNFQNFNLTEEELAQVYPAVRELILDRTFFVEGQPLVFLSPNCNQVLGSFINHSNEPNTDGVEALRDIKTGEEITKDYGLISPIPHEITKNKYKDII